MLTTITSVGNSTKIKIELSYLEVAAVAVVISIILPEEAAVVLISTKLEVKAAEASVLIALPVPALVMPNTAPEQVTPVPQFG